MHFYIIQFFADILKIVARRNYYNSFFCCSQSVKKCSLFWFFSILSEFVLFYFSHIFSGSKTINRALFFILINCCINLSLTLFYEVKKLSHRILIAFSLQAINQVSEIIMGSLLFAIIPKLFEESSEIQDTYVIVCSGILSFLILTFISALCKIKISIISHRHLFLMCSTPLASVSILLLLPYQIIVSQDNCFRIICILAILLVVNIINHYLLQDIIYQANLEMIISNQQNQLSYQSEKFSQLSSAYKETRRIVHEVKRYNSYVTSCVHKKEYDKIIDFIQESSKELEERFVTINTGNLVIDTFITNYDSMAKEKGIPFYCDIKIDKDDIPINDYDLCIVLGNLIDNSFNEAESFFSGASAYKDFYITTKLLTTEKFFVIHVANPITNCKKKPTGKPALEHGFGIINVQEIVKKYKGLYFQNTDNGIFETTVSIPVYH